MRGVVVVALALGLSCSLPKNTSRPPDVRSLRFEIRDVRTGELIPGRLTLVPNKRTRVPKLSASSIGERSGSALLAANRIMSTSGRGNVRVPSGTYDVYVSRGPEWTIHIARGVVIGAEGALVEAKLRRVVDTTDWVSADFHVHASPSWDSNVPLEYRVIEFLVEGVELITGTDHNVVTDYGPVIEDLGVEQAMGSVVGDEVTSLTRGHFGVFPVPAEAAGETFGMAYRNSKNIKRVVRAIRKRFPGALVQINHPRSLSQRGYFSEFGYDPKTGKARRKGFTLRFDAIEVFNGSAAPDRALLNQGLRDWFQLILHGHILTATGNSDTHRLSSLGGYPRNYLRVGHDDPAKVRPSELLTAMRTRRVQLTTGPFLEFEANGGSIGDTVSAPDGTVAVSFAVRAAPWVSVSKARLYVDGVVVKTWKIDPRTTIVDRFRATHELQVARDAFVVLRVDGNRPLGPVVGTVGSFAVYPFALTNPIFVDVDGNGDYDAPLARPVR